MIFVKIRRFTWLKSLAFWNLILLCITLGLGTFAEKNHGSEFAYDHFYGTWWFVALWAILIGLTGIGLICSKSHRNIPLLLIHLSFIVILSGAMCTRIFSTQGIVVLHSGGATSLLNTDNGQLEFLPFSMKLDTFYVQYYPGTDAPADYISHITMTDASGYTTHAKASMNKIIQHDDYRFYQASYEPDGKTSVLHVNRDIWGIVLTYSGYALFVLSMLWFLLSPSNPFRKLMKHPLLKTTTLFVLFLIPGQVSAATFIDQDSLTIEANHAKEFGKLHLLYEGHITSVSAFAHDFTLKLTGKPVFAHLQAEQVLMGFLFLPEKWQQVALFEVKNPVLRQELHSPGGKASINDFFDEQGRYKLSKYWAEISLVGAKTPLLKEAEKLNDKVQLINMLHSGSLLQIFPLNVNGNVQWMQPLQTLPAGISTTDSLFVRNALTRYYQALMGNKKEEPLDILHSILHFQQRMAGQVLPSEQKRDLEIFYLKAGFSSVLFKVNLSLGLLAFLAFFSYKGEKKLVNILSCCFLMISFVTLSLSIGLRAYIAGRLPISNGFETMLAIAWCALLLALFLYRRIPISVPFGFLLSGCALLVAHLGMSNPKITPLMPVLSSPLLSIHVSIIMLAYTLLAFVAINSFTTLFQILIHRKTEQQTLNTLLERHKIYSLLCLYPALLFLGAGIFVGAVWANISWGRYWAWDPKEVWALITFLIYGLALHPRISFIASRFWFHVFGLLAFSTVLMTYFGVNYILGGMHSYAGEMDLTGTWILVVIAVIFLSLIIGFSHRKYRKSKL
jgi:ABC-type transport system involved in cytochrome c biogenesis permease subunit